MKKNPFRKLLTSRRGISMTEVVVSLTMITMITAAAISIVVASIQFEVKYLNQVTALRNCESIAACVRYAQDENTFTPLLEKLGFEKEEIVFTEETNTFTLVKPSYTIKLTVDFDTNQYAITAVGQNDETIYEAYDETEITSPEG